MPVLGKAIATHLRKLAGLYSVELPAKLRHEIFDIVSACNQGHPSRALFVVDEDLSTTGVKTTSWAELLGWRTSDDRVFVWERGSREPDTSFQSVVKPFISSRFPGSPGGECTLDLLANLSIEELWTRNGLEPVGETFDAFLDTAKWVAGVLRHAFERVGSLPSAHWSDEFLVHWARMLDLLDQGLDNLPQLGVTLQPRHAWELLRVAGLPVPAKIAASGNPFLQTPRMLPERDRISFAKSWQDIVEEHMLTEGDRAVLLTALDWTAKGAEKTSSWRSLDWNVLKDVSLHDIVAAPTVGQDVFTSKTSPSLLSTQPPAYPVAPKPSWWGVTEADIRQAIAQLRETTFFRPSPSCTALEAVPGQEDMYWLKTRLGSISHLHPRRGWKAEVLIEDLVMEFKAPWSKLTVSHLQPSQRGKGNAWINPDDVSLEVAGRDVNTAIKQLSVTSGTQLEIKFDLTITYTARADEESEAVSGKWRPIRTMRIKAKVRDCIEGVWRAASRNVDSSVKLVVPSPFSPTALVAPERGKPSIAPNTGDIFTSGLAPGAMWEADAIPDVILKEEGRHEISVYDGCLATMSPSFSAESELLVNDAVLPSQGRGPGLYSDECNLDEGDVISAVGPGGTHDIAVVKVRQRSSSLSSGLLSAVKGLSAGQKAPSSQARSSLPGQYQVQVTRALCNPLGGKYNSLYQYVVSNSEVPTSWPEHEGEPAPGFLFEIRKGFTLPGIGNGPSLTLVNCPEWETFMNALGRVCDVIGLEPGAEETWLSGFDPSDIPAQVIRAYVVAQRDLVRAAKRISQADTFWASYPFSIMIVEGKMGASLGQLLAVFLSPLHPARLAWAFAVALTARSTASKEIKGLIGLAEGWNIPYTGNAVSTVGQQLPMVAIPTDPGTEQDFVTWSALAVLDRDGLARLPAIAAGLPLPWGGQTGINRKVVARALKDYLAVHPHINSLEVDIRSVSDAPRSREIDEAVLQLVGGATILEEVDKLSGGTRVQDSTYRLGLAPTRDDLFLLREEEEHDKPFEWRRYHPPNVPTNADVAFIENSSVHLTVNQGNANGLIGCLPLRRFCPFTLRDLVLEQNYSVSPGDDLLGLASLLAEIECGEENFRAALRAIPQAHALGIGMGARWEILGTFNIDPALLSSVVATQAQSSGKRLLWEWRPSWLGYSRRDTDIAKRPYYVVGRIPASLLKALYHRQGFTDAQAFEMLFELGRRGIGLTSLHAAGGTQESAAAGFFYALMLLLPPEGHSLVAEWTSVSDKTTICCLIPLDPIESMLEELAGQRLQYRADLLAVRITQTETTNICFVPIEVKHHGQVTAPEPIPDHSNKELMRARKQLAQTADVLVRIGQAIRPDPSNIGEMLSCYTRLLGLATLIELAMSLMPVPPKADKQASVLRNIINGKVSIGVGHPILLWFAPGTTSISGEACLVDPHGTISQDDWMLREVFIDPAAVQGLWWRNQVAAADEKQTRDYFDEAMINALSACRSESDTIDIEIAKEISILLGVNSLVTGDERQVAKLPDTEEDALDRDEASRLVDSTAEQKEAPVADRSSETADQVKNAVKEPDAEVASPATSAQSVTQVPKAFVGWTQSTSRWSIIGKMAGTNELAALDLDHPKAIGIFGYMGSGKSYLLGTMVEAALESIPQLNALPVPLAVVIFNYRRNATDRFELSSLAFPNRKPSDTERLANDYGAAPRPVRDIHILCLPGELTPARLQEYSGLLASELFFNPATLTVEDWELLMGEPGSSAVFARTIRHALRELRSLGEITLDSLEHHVAGMLRGQSRTAAQLRFEFVRRYLSREQSVDFNRILKPGRAVILDLRQPLFNKSDALRFFLICSNYVSRVQGQFNKLVVFDEAHEYLSDEFEERIDARIRLMRHEGTSYTFATQDVSSIPSAIRRFITTRFVFNLGTRENVEDLVKFAPEFDGHDLQRMEPGYCLVQANQSVQGVFRRPRVVYVRPRVTQHGGASRIFSAKGSNEEKENDKSRQS
jgi:DNA helicase HerA-like ATPase